MVEKINLPEASIRLLQAGKESLKILLEEVVPQSVKKERKCGYALFSSVDKRYSGIASHNLNILPKSLAKEKCVRDVYTLVTQTS